MHSSEIEKKRLPTLHKQCNVHYVENKPATTISSNPRKVRQIIGEGVGTSNFTTTTGHFFQYIKNGFLVDHYYDITTSKMAF